MTLKLLAKKLHENAVLPSKGTLRAAAWDFYALQDTEVTPAGNIKDGLVTIVRTGVAVKIPSGYRGDLKLRSGFSKRGAVITAGVIDEDYIGEIMFMLRYPVGDAFAIKAGEKFGQMELTANPDTVLEEVADFSPEIVAEAAHVGFGSTGGYGGGKLELH